MKLTEFLSINDFPAIDIGQIGKMVAHMQNMEIENSVIILSDNRRVKFKSLKGGIDCELLPPNSFSNKTTVKK